MYGIPEQNDHAELQDFSTLGRLTYSRIRQPNILAGVTVLEAPDVHLVERRLLPPRLRRGRLKHSGVSLLEIIGLPI